MQKTILNIKIDPQLKGQARAVAQEIGLPLSTIVNSYLRDLIREKRVVFAAPPVPNQHTQKILKALSLDFKNGKNAAGPFSQEEAIAYLDQL